jgi:ankyrin repeat protein
VNLRGGKYGSALQAASSSGNAGVVRILLEHGAKVDSSLQIASLGGFDDIVRTLLDHGADPNSGYGKSFGTALQTATSAGRSKTVQVLLDAGANANQQGTYFGTALQIASGTGNRSLVWLLLDKGADPSLRSGGLGLSTTRLLDGELPTPSKGELLAKRRLTETSISPLEAASAAGHDDIVSILLVFLPKFISNWDEYQTEWLFTDSMEKAASNGHEKVVQLLLDHRPEYGVVSDDYEALQMACRNGHEEVVRILLGNGARMNAKRAHRAETPLPVATKGNHDTIIQLLLQYGAKIEQDGKYGSALHIASYRGFENLVRLFLDKEADANTMGTSSCTPLLLASYARNESIVHILLHYGADPRMIMRGWCDEDHEYATITEYKTALQAAAYAGHEGICRLLIGHPLFNEIRKPEE